MTKTRTLRLTDRQVEVLESLFAALDISGQRGARFNAGIAWLAETADGGMAETVAALEIAAGCAAGEDWDELIEIIRPEWSE
jgi:hypothetical protein